MSVGHDYRLAQAFDLFDFALQMRAEQARREVPGATEEQVKLIVSAWIRERPGASFGDASGRPGNLSRFA